MWVPKETSHLILEVFFLTRGAQRGWSRAFLGGRRPCKVMQVCGQTWAPAALSLFSSLKGWL